ncbi:oligosaccharide repeat unit polymerase [Metabacillus malikii]|uniref:Oligosaccharide repeat unit polymerase n=2 Tax=Metabacillus malikii TaxID=1504265 RepID=A0ABT9ZL87_9BACI|nr:oligosaccharide repeat unit polymerase [Metabacillus malikii]
MYTWLIIIIFQIVYNIGCVLGKKQYRNNRFNKQDSNIAAKGSSERDLRIAIIILSLLTSISTISNILIAVRSYGFNLLEYTNQIYVDRLAGDIDTGIPYLGSFVYPALIYAGFYFEKFGFKKIILLPVLLLALGGLKTGGRLGILIGAFLLLVPIILQRGRVIKEKVRKVKGRKGKNIKILISSSILIALFITITNNRASWETYNPYMSPLMVKVLEYNPAIYQIYTYITLPLGVLNEFLKDPTLNFGGHTFLTIYNLLNRLGADISVNQYQTFYNVPLPSNVGTYIRELIEDFSIPLALMVTLITGLILSYNYSKFRNDGLYMNLIWASTFAFVIFFSFFMWQFRSSTIWITIVVGSISGYILDQRHKKRLKRYEFKE